MIENKQIVSASPRGFEIAIKVIAEAAQKFMALDSELVQWMEEQGIDVAYYNVKLGDHIHGGCASIVNPKESEEAILQFLKCW